MNQDFILKDDNSLSQNLFIAYLESHIPLSEEFVCFKCFGILIDPLKCTKCKLACCKTCLFKIDSSPKIVCQCCDKMNEENFVKCDISNLDKTFYLIYEDMDFLVSHEYQYYDAIQKFSGSQKAFPPYFTSDQALIDVNPYEFIFQPQKIEEIKKERIQKIMNNEQNKFKLRKRIDSKKITKLINFNYTKGYEYSKRVVINEIA